MIASPTQARPSISSSACWPVASRCPPAPRRGYRRTRTDRRARCRQARPVIGLAGDQAAARSSRAALARAGVRHRGVDFVGQRGIDRTLRSRGEIDETLGKVGVVGGERRLDLARGHRGVECLVERAVWRSAAGSSSMRQREIAHRTRAAPRNRRRPPAARQTARRRDATSRQCHALLHLRWREALRRAAAGRRCPWG